MKKIYFVLLILIIILTYSGNTVLAVTPQYQLYATNFSLNCGIYTTLDWDIYMVNTGTVPIEYANGQYLFTFDPAIGNGGNLTFRLLSSDLPVEIRPVYVTVNGNILRLYSPLPPPNGSGFFISSDPGNPTKIATVRLKTSSTSFSGNNFYPQWINPPTIPCTSVFAYENGNVVNITGTNNYISEDYCGMFTNSPWECCHAVLLSPKVIPEGLYDSSSGKLNRKDTLTVELRNTTYPYSVIESRKCRLDSLNFSAFYPYTVSFMTRAYLCVKHHNSLETWSSINIGFLRNGYITTYDLTASDSAAYGNNLKYTGNKFCLYSGDVNQDKKIDLGDLLEVFNDSQNFVTGYSNSDLNGDNLVNISDLNIVYNNTINFIQTISPLD